MKSSNNKVIFAVVCLLAITIPAIRFLKHSDDAVNTFSPETLGQVVVIDPGHGGEDGGAISISGAIESNINLAIGLRLDALMGLYAIPTILLRDSDISLHDPDAKTLRQKKNSDLKNRVTIIEALDKPTLLSIHQNTFTDSKYHGAQVFYSNGESSRYLAQTTQDVLRQVLDPSNDRKIKPAPDNVYLMKHITCRAILVECGFLSNPTEDQLLQSDTYQTQIAAALTGAYLQFRHTAEKGEGIDAT